MPMRRRAWVAALPLLTAAWPSRPAWADAGGGDPYGSLAWPLIQREFAEGATVSTDPRIEVVVPRFAEDPMNVPVSVRIVGLADIERVRIVVDRNPIRQVLDFLPLAALPQFSFRFKLEQASPVRALVRTKGGRWLAGHAWVDSSGGGCTVPGATRKDGSWSQTLGQVSGRLLQSTAPGTAGTPGAVSRLRVRVMHPMDTGLVGGIPAFYVNRLSLRDGQGRELARLETFEPVSENPVFSFDFATPPPGGVRIVGSDNNGNRIQSLLQ